MKSLLKILAVAIVAALVCVAVAELATVIELSEKEGMYLIALVECMCIPMFVHFFDKD